MASAHVIEGTDPQNRRSDDARATLDEYGPDNPPPGIWLGVSVENQAAADERVPELLQTPAAVRFLSCEPMLGPVSFRWAAWVNHKAVMATHGSVGHLDGLRGIHWVIAGGESGPGARPMHPDWARSLRDECKAAGVPFFFKQWGAWREFPTPSGEDESVADESAEADDIFARAVNPGFVTRGGRVILDRDDLPDDGTPCRLMERVGKKAAGAMLDGREWREMPCG